MTKMKCLYWSIAWSLLVAGLGAAEATAGEPAPCRRQARAKLAEATALATDESFIAAQAVIDEGLACDPRNTDLLHLRAKMALDRLDFAGALAGYEKLLQAGLSGANRRKVQAIIQMLSPARSTFVEIAVNVAADVYVDGKARGKACDAAPVCRVPVLPRTYRIFVERPGFKPVRHVVRVRRGETVTLNLDLEELPSPFTLSVTPADAVVTLDGKLWRPGEPAEAAELPAGEHELRVWREGFFAHEAKISARLGEPIALSIDLEERVPVSVSPPGARLLLDGKPVKLRGRAVRPSDIDRRLVAQGVVRLPAERRGQALEIVVEAEGHEPMTVTLPAEREPGDVLDIALAPVPPPPPPPPPTPDGPLGPRIIMATTGATALTSLGVAAFQAYQAQQHMDRAMEHCTPGAGGGLSCTDEGKAELRAADHTATRSNQAFALGTAFAVGTLYAANLGEETPTDSMSLRRKLSIGASAGVALAGLAAGTVYGLRARRLHAQAEAWCSDAARCEGEGYVLMHQARSATGVANLGFTVAGVAAVGATLLWWRAPEPSAGTESRLRIEPVIQPGEVGLSISGGFQ
jgi:hypothetical protein